MHVVLCLGILMCLGTRDTTGYCYLSGIATDRRRQTKCSVGLLYVDDVSMSVRWEIVWL